MDIKDFDYWCRNLLDFGRFAADDSVNGIQVGHRARPLKTIAFAVDACAETIVRSAQCNADVLFVHHGLLWGAPARIIGNLRERIRLLIEADIALYACHLPLDAHPEIGHNAVLARMVGLSGIAPFGEYHGVDIGFAGSLDTPATLEEIIARILPDGSRPRCVLPGTMEKIKSVAIVSGGAPMSAFEAINKGIDLFITGEPSHTIYQDVIESGKAFIAAGHYATEVWGLKELARTLEQKTGLATRFIDLPTGL